MAAGVLWHQQVALELLAVQQELSSCKARLSDTARQLSAVRTTVKDTTRELAQEQQRSQAATCALEELKAELDKARR
jgi:ribosomal protein S20